MSDDTSPIRDQLVAQLTGLGAPSTTAHLIADIAIHAAEEGWRAMTKVCARLPGSDANSAAQIAGQLLEEVCRVKTLELIATMRAQPGVREGEVLIGPGLAALQQQRGTMQ